MEVLRVPYFKLPVFQKSRVLFFIGLMLLRISCWVIYFFFFFESLMNRIFYLFFIALFGLWRALRLSSELLEET